MQNNDLFESIDSKPRLAEPGYDEFLMNLYAEPQNRDYVPLNPTPHYLPKNAITMISGPMFSGKSQFLIDTLNLYKDKALLIRPGIDDRGFLTRSNSKLDPSVKIMTVKELPDIGMLQGMYPNLEIIGIDEGQFFPNIMDTNIYADAGYVVAVSSLRFTSEAQWFKGIIEFQASVDYFIELSANCSDCGAIGKGCFTVTRDTKNIKMNQIQVGDDIYKVVCRKCFNKHIEAMKAAGVDEEGNIIF